jgi:single-strand DNA-binding protein
MYQLTIVVGNLGRTPELRETPDGIPVTDFSMAANRRWTNSDGTPGEATVWFKVTAWRRLAEVCAEYLEKGRLVLVQGELNAPQIWTGRDGEPRASLNLTARVVKFLGSNGNVERTVADEGEDEIPF